jgi:hypothetical protein
MGRELQGRGAASKKANPDFFERGGGRTLFPEVGGFSWE